VRNANKATGASYDKANWVMAMEKSQLWGDVIPIGKFFQRTDQPSLEACEPVLDEGGPLAHRDLSIAAETVRGFIAELM
jgi:2-oxoglutarate/2-oxoacid ferredoxin oxidoreductase subunit beta